ncbi:MAG: winged helix-turn-helix domain-containing protein [Terriglobales bacterium]|jgi:DNA-binding winged helix-turn-helix (wHTH) protein/tetratricopeptide (TPR) repeat protein/TolB-like protein
MKSEGIFQFGEFQIDVLARALRRQDEIITLNRRAFDVLLYLVQNPGRVLTRDELLKNVWPDTFVDENTLAQSISALRRALEEKPGDNNFIVTLPGRGYQFVSAVTVVVPDSLSVLPDAVAASNHTSGGVLLQRQTIRTSVITEDNEQLGLPGSRNRSVRLIAFLVLATISVAGFYSWRKFHRTPVPTNPAAMTTLGTPVPARRSVAVLGFRNLSGRPEEGWISTALAEMLSTELEAGEKLRLISGEDIAHTKLDLSLADADSLSRTTLAQLHKNLDSDLIVLGSYTVVGDKPGARIRLDLRLQDTVAGETIADVGVVGGEADLFDMVSQAGSRLREKLGVEAVSPVEAVGIRASLPSKRDAARLYSEGLARLREFDAIEARDLLRQAVAADPKYSPAHSALAEAWSRLGYDKKAQAEAKQAFDLSANLSREDKLAAEGRYREIDHQYERAIEVYRALFTLFPDNVDYGIKLAWLQCHGGKGHDALATVESLRRLAPPASEDPRIDLEEGDAWDALNDPKRGTQPTARALEKARARGARLIQAQALQGQCWWFSSLGQNQDALAACRESRDIYAAAGDPHGEATALRTWADALAVTDAPESIRLYQQAQTLYRRIGSEGGVASVVNNLGLVYEARGDLATAEKMHRQALASFQLLDNKRSQADATGNVADERMEQGDLPGALRLYQDQLRLQGQLQSEDSRNLGTFALPGYNIALIRQLQGDLAGARQGFQQSLAVWQENSVQYYSAYAMWSLGSLSLEEADFSGSRKMYEQALTLRTAAGEKLAIAETQLALADLSLEEARSPGEQEAVVRQALEIFRTQRVRDDETGAWCVLARALLAKGKAADAKDAAQHARSLAAKSQNPEIRWRAAITAARVETAGKNLARSAVAGAARHELSTIIAKSRELGYVGIELDARLALAEIEMKDGQLTAGRAHLAILETDAKAKGYNLIARKAALARS